MSEPAAAGPPPAPPAGSPPRPPSRGADRALRVAGGVVAVYGAVITALIEIAYTPLHAGRWPVPISIPLAIVLNAALVWFAYRATGHKGAALLPGIVWFGIIVAAAQRTTEGDLALISDWVSLGTIFGGTIGWAVGAYRLIVPSLAR
ncbi:hypothetical protein [Rhizomonospora bruguierae]|uniref:hypothetical protein n=1 Tax=Rhizomonospora bruguierae TaxID=1581705 RepID=UPI001BCD6802|nr:hypothetical protein [Micromonospora sp. NBRC 107566]